MTRTELLTARGYDPETIAGNGHGHADEGAEASPGPAELTCRGCATPLANPRQQWCTNACRKRHSRPAAAARRQERGQAVPEKPIASNGNTATSAPAPPPSLLGALEAVAGQLPAAWSVQVAAGQVSLRWHQPASSTT
jgi:hypothetical protein